MIIFGNQIFPLTDSFLFSSLFLFHSILVFFCFLNEITSQISLRFEVGNFFLLISLLFPSLFLFLLESGFPLSVILSHVAEFPQMSGDWQLTVCLG